MMCRRHASYRPKPCNCYRCRSKRVYRHYEETDFKQCSRRSRSHYCNDSFDKSASNPFDLKDYHYEKHTKPAYEDKSYNRKATCGCSRCTSPSRRKNDTCYCYESN